MRTNGKTLLFYLALGAMPARAVLLPESLDRTVVFLFDDRTQHGINCPWPVEVGCGGVGAGCRTRTYCPNGTGFLSGFPDKQDPDKGWSVLVTAGHIVRDLPASLTLFARVTTGEEKSSFHPLDKSHWQLSSDDREDIAIYASHVPDVDKGVTVSTHMFATERVLKARGAAAGDSILTLGLVPPLAGNKRNYPVTRQGTLALMDSAPEGPGQGVWYFAEGQTYEGNSGGPVFLYLGGARGGTFVSGSEDFYLIGITRGYIQQPTQLGLRNIGLQAFTRVDVLLKMLCSPSLLKGAPPSADTSDCAALPH
jgi:hypothetical protein